MEHTTTQRGYKKKGTAKRNIGIEDGGQFLFNF
jgi:hypothetical protein